MIDWDEMMLEMEREFGPFGKMDKHFMKMWRVLMDMLFEEHDTGSPAYSSPSGAATAMSGDCSLYNNQIRQEMIQAENLLPTMGGTGPMMAAAIKSWRRLQDAKC